MIHKKKMKDKFLRCLWQQYNGSWEDYVAHQNKHTSTEYWKTYPMTGARRYASWCSRRKIRATFRHENSHVDFEDMLLPQRGCYKKYFDFWWTIY